MPNNGPHVFTAYLSPVDGPMIHHHILVPEEVALNFRRPKGAVRILCSIENGIEFPCALNPRRAGYVIMASKQLIKKHRLLVGVPFRVAVRTDLNDGLEIPEELAEVLAQDEFGNRKFEALLPGIKRSLLYYIRSAKSSYTRIKRSLEIVEKVKLNKLHSQQNSN